MFTAVIIEPAARLAAEPTSFDIFHQQWTGAVLGICQSLIKHLHHAEAGVQADEIGKLKRSHGMVGAQPHSGIDGIHIAHAFIERIDRFVDHRQQDAVDDEGREVFGIGRVLPLALRFPEPIGRLCHW